MLRSSPNPVSSNVSRQGHSASRAEYSLFGALSGLIALGSLALTNHPNATFSVVGWKVTVILVCLACIAGLALAGRKIGPIFEVASERVQERRR